VRAAVQVRRSGLRTGEGRSSTAPSRWDLPRCDDINQPDSYGVSLAPYNIKNGKRQSTTVAYLNPARGRRSLKLSRSARRRAEAFRTQSRGRVFTEGGQRRPRWPTRSCSPPAFIIRRTSYALGHRSGGGAQAPRHPRGNARPARSRRKLSGPRRSST
jgi:choline dehydrogenase-like flavoprotein